MSSSQVTASHLSSLCQKTSILILADSDHERTKWVSLLLELHRILKKNKLKDRSVYVPKEAYDSTLPLIKTTQTAAIIGTALTHHQHCNTPLRRLPVSSYIKHLCAFCVFLYCFWSLDHERVALGNEEGLYVVHVTKDGESMCLNA